jgi:hypothetical protein
MTMKEKYNTFRQDYPLVEFALAGTAVALGVTGVLVLNSKRYFWNAQALLALEEVAIRQFDLEVAQWTQAQKQLAGKK